MTDKARELLEWVVDVWGDDEEVIYANQDREALMNEIRTYLAEPTKDDEPVAWIREVGIDNPISALVRTQHECGDCNIPLYLHPAPRPEFVRLSEEEVNSLTCAPYEPYELICAVENRLVEKNRG